LRNHYNANVIITRKNAISFKDCPKNANVINNEKKRMINADHSAIIIYYSIDGKLILSPRDDFVSINTILRVSYIKIADTKPPHLKNFL